MTNNQNVPPVLYHYTSWKTLKDIVENHTWRFSSINRTNDLSEDLNLYVKQLLNDKNLINNISDETKQDIIQHIDLDNFYGVKNYFIACFSTEEDDLGQWRTSYGDYGRGVCIGINSAFFTNHLYLEDCKKLGWVDIAYDIQTQKQRLSAITAKLEEPDEEWGCDNTYILAQEIRDAAITMKHRAFHIENEYRLIVSMIGEEILDNNFHSLVDDFKKPEKDRLYFKKNTNPNIQEQDIVKCIDYDLNSHARVGNGNLIRSILLGKDCPKDLYDVKDLLEENNFNSGNIDIKKSNIPYRFSDDRKRCKNDK